MIDNYFLISLFDDEHTFIIVLMMFILDLVICIRLFRKTSQLIKQSAAFSDTLNKQYKLINIMIIREEDDLNHLVKVKEDIIFLKTQYTDEYLLKQAINERVSELLKYLEERLEQRKQNLCEIEKEIRDYKISARERNSWNSSSSWKGLSGMEGIGLDDD